MKLEMCMRTEPMWAAPAAQRPALAWPLLVTNTPDWRPISVGLQQFVSEAGAEVHLQMAGAVIATFPVLLAYFLIQREFTEGISMSGLKG